MKIEVVLIGLLLLSKSDVNENKFEGKWALCKIECEEQIILFNLCSEIIFESYNNGYLILPQNRIEFNYRVNKESNQFHIDFKQSQNLFDENTYQFIFKEKNELIVQSKDNCSYIFNRQTE